MSTRGINLAGKRFGRLTAIERDGNIGTSAAWICKCDCGRTTKKAAGALRMGHVSSCGCLQKETRKFYATGFKRKRVSSAFDPCS